MDIDKTDHLTIFQTAEANLLQCSVRRIGKNAGHFFRVDHLELVLIQKDGIPMMRNQLEMRGKPGTKLFKKRLAAFLEGENAPGMGRVCERLKDKIHYMPIADSELRTFNVDMLLPDQLQSLFLRLHPH